MQKRYEITHRDRGIENPGISNRGVENDSSATQVTAPEYVKKTVPQQVASTTAVTPGKVLPEEEKLPTILIIGPPSVIGRSDFKFCKDEDISCLDATSLEDIVAGIRDWGLKEENKRRYIFFINLFCHGPVWIKDEKGVIAIQEPYISLDENSYFTKDFLSFFRRGSKILKKHVYPLTKQVEGLELNTCNLGYDDEYDYFRQFREKIAMFFIGSEGKPKKVKVKSYNAYKDLLSDDYSKDPVYLFEGISMRIAEKAQVDSAKIIIEHFNRFTRELK